MDHEDPFEILAGFVKANGCAGGNIGIEESFLTVAQYRRIKEWLPQSRFTDVSGLVDGIRVKLSGTEVEYLRKAAAITNLGFQHGLQMIREGVYPYEVIGEVYDVMYKAGQSDMLISKVWFWSGPRGGLMHDTDITRKVREDDLATFELWGTCQHYIVGAQCTIHIGKAPPAEIVDHYATVSRMYQAARDILRPGAHTGDVYEAANAVYRGMKGRDYWRRIGSSMGLSFGPIHIEKDGRDTIQPWTGFIMQPLVVEPALITCCSTLLVTDTGVEELTPALINLRKI